MYPVDHLPQHSIRTVAESLRSIFEQLSADLPTHASQRLARSFVSFSKWILSYYEFAVQASATDPNPPQSLRRIDAVFSGVLRQVQMDCSRLIHPPGVEDFPQELALWAKHWLCIYGGYDANETSVALIPHWPFCPEIHSFSNPLKKIETEIEAPLQLMRLDGFTNELSTHPDQFLLFTFPRAEGRNILFHPMLLHEFGHGIDFKQNLVQRVWSEVVVPANTDVSQKKVIGNWLREFVADLLATRLGGPCFALALHEVSVIAKVLDYNSDMHPASRTRLALVMEHLDRLKYPKDGAAHAVLGLLNSWRTGLISKLPAGAGTGHDLQRSVLLSDEFRPHLHQVVDDYCTGIGHKGFDFERFTALVPDLVSKLQAGMPPIPVNQGSPLPGVFNAAWELVLTGGKLFEEYKEIEPDQLPKAIRALSGLAFKGIEAAQVLDHWNAKPTPESGHDNQERAKPSEMLSVPKAAVLTEEEIRWGLLNKIGFAIDPILEPSQIMEGSVNLRLGTHFLVTKGADLASVQPHNLDGVTIRRFQHHVSKSFGETFVLHPRRLVLGATFEYIALPDDYAALVLSRSSYGRIGLIVATATYVHPGWKGCLTLELSNVADIPLELLCGASIAQLIVFRADRLPSRDLKDFRDARHPYPTFPEFAPLAGNPDWPKLKDFAERMEGL